MGDLLSVIAIIFLFVKSNFEILWDYLCWNDNSPGWCASKRFSPKFEKLKRASAQVVIFGEPMRKRAVMSKYQCANGNHRLRKGADLSECQCANGDPHMRTTFSKIPIGPLWHKKRAPVWQWPAKIGVRQIWPYYALKDTNNAQNDTNNACTVRINARKVFYC